MKEISSTAEMQQAALSWREQGRRIGLVPTMGFLHEGHASLMRLLRGHCDTLVVSLFVNPTQFGPNEDLESYPRDLARDRALCEREGVDILYAPPVEQVYAPDASVVVDETRLSTGLCGAARPGHFRGVATVVAKLFNIVQPHLAAFGEKDAQQLRVIRRMVRDLNFPVTLLAGPTVREADGLALSSRNSLLDPAARAQATCLRRALDLAERMYRGGETDTAVLHRALRELIGRSPAARVDYIEFVDDETLERVLHIERPCLVALAVFLGGVRLIDNTVLMGRPA